MLSIFRKELLGFFQSLVAYLVLATFFIFCGLILWVLPATNLFDYGFAEPAALFSFAPYLFLFLIPAITMRMIAEERKTGTWELLQSLPLTTWQVILGKYAAACVLVALALLPFALYYLAISSLGSPAGNVDGAAFLTSTIGLWLIGCVFAAVGLFTSALTTNQITSFLLAAFLCYIGFDGLAQLTQLTKGTLFAQLEYLSWGYHYEALGRGVVDTRNFLFLMSWSLLALQGTRWQFI